MKINNKKLEKIVVNNMLDVNKIFEKHSDLLNFLKINEFVNTIKFEDLMLTTTKHCVNPKISYHKAAIKVYSSHLRIRFRPNLCRVESVDLTTDEGKEKIVMLIKVKWKKFRERIYPEYIHLIK